MPIWRKASERLPPPNSGIMHLKQANWPGIGVFSPSRKKFLFNEKQWFPIEEIEWLDESESSFSIEDMREAWGDGSVLPEHGGNSTFEQFMKEQYNIDI